MLALARAVTTVAISLAGAATLAGQTNAAPTLRGTVVLPDSTTPASGVIVLASDARGATAGRALTNARGQFVVALPVAGRYSFALLRIGFRPTRIPAITIAEGATEVVRFVLDNQPVVLSSINVRERETCRVSADTGFMVARVWEEARKAMLTTQLNPGDAPLFAEWIEYDRVLDSTARLVREQRIRVSRHPTTHAFRSRPAAALDSTGYVIADNTGTTYFAPDADVLLSEVFAAAHCFQLVTPPSPAMANFVGVRFQPARERRDGSEIEGTLWVDRSSAELRTLDFRYTNLPDVARTAGAGGKVEFLRLHDGNWLVSKWHIRMPRVTASRQYSAGGLRQVAPAGVVSGIQITGGEVTRVTRHDTLVHEATGPAIVVQLVSRDTLVPSAAARLTLEGTDYAAAADLWGRIRLTPVLAGRYRARVSTPLMDSLGVRPIIREVEAREDTQDAHVDSLNLPRARDFVVAACPRDSVEHGEGMLHGRVRDESARALQDAAVTVTWQSNFAAIGTRDGGQLSYTERTIGALTNDAGYWRVCGVPRQTPLAVHVTTDTGSDFRRVRLEESQEFGVVDLVVRRHTSALNREVEATLGELRRSRALVEIAVSELGGSLIPDATVEIDASGQKRTVVTGPGGRALVADIAPGLLVVRAKRVGFRPGQFAVTVEAGRNTIPIILSRVSLPSLDTVRVVGNRRTAGLGRLDEFETRRLNHTATVSLSRADIIKRNPVDTWQMLTNVASIRVVDSAAVTAESARSMRTRPDLTVEPCYLMVMVDGVMMTDPRQKAFDLRLLPRPEEVHGIEVFAGAASIPLQYGGIGDNKSCGLIAIWTR